MAKFTPPHFPTKTHVWDGWSIPLTQAPDLSKQAAEERAALDRVATDVARKLGGA